MNFQCATQLDCDLSAIDDLHLFLREAIADTFGDGATIALTERIVLAVHEAFTNIVRHGQDAGREQPIVVRCLATGGDDRATRLTVELIDCGRAFDPIAAALSRAGSSRGGVDWRGPPSSHNIGTTGGYGLSMIHSLASDLSYAREQGRNHLLLTFNNEGISQ